MPYKSEEKRKANAQRYYQSLRQDKHKYYLANKDRWAAYVRSTNGRFHRFKARAKRRGFEWGLSLEEYTLLSSLPCSYCGGLLPPTGGGLDRQDHRLGYILGNTVPCCTRCNSIKGAIEMAGFMYPRTVELLKERLQ